MPASALVAVSDPVLARSQPAAPWLVSGSRNRSDRVPLPPATGSRSTSGRSAGWSGPAARLTTSSRLVAVSRSSTDRPLESYRVAPVISTPARDSRSVTAWTAPAKLRGR